MITELDIAYEKLRSRLVKCTFTLIISLNQSSVAEWLRWWVNLGVMPPLSDWEVVGSNPIPGMSRIGFFYPRKKFQWFSLAENVSYLFSTQQNHLVAYL